MNLVRMSCGAMFVLTAVMVAGAMTQIDGLFYIGAIGTAAIALMSGMCLVVKWKDV